MSNARNLADINVSTFTGKTVGVDLDTTTTTTLLTNPNGSNKTLRVTGIFVANIDGTNAAQVTMDYYNGTTGFKFASTVNVPANTTIVLLDKNSYLYLEENKSIRGGANATGDLQVVISYEEIS